MEEQVPGMRLFVMVIVVAACFAAAAAVASSPPEARPAVGSLGFVQAGHCYRISFSIQGAPNYKVLEVLDGGWLRAEVDAGPASADRQSIWINSGQIVTLREVRCSE